jgi:hypothetical protein
MPKRVAGILFGLLALAGSVVGVAVAQERPAWTDEFVEKLARDLAQIAERQRVTLYFDAAPSADVQAYLEMLGFNVSVQTPPEPAPSGNPGAAPPMSLPPVVGPPTAPSGPTSGPVAVRVPDSRDRIQALLLGVRDLVKTLPADSPLQLDGVTVDLPAGSVHFRLR